MRDDALDQLDYYTLLGVARDADVADIRRAFRKFAQKYHPDRFAGAPPDKVERAHHIYRRGSEGFEVLTDPVTRKAYDQTLARGLLRLTAEERDIAHARATTNREEAPAPRSERALALYHRAAAAARERDWLGAWRLLRAALEIEPDNAEMKLRLQQVAARVRAAGLGPR
ncbi:MAG: DnaJ domain-containing protein [Deltaproteobacteria bacterium]|nr:DnaJ domain-containing protein [Deltaproteobacteria bacterium]